MKIGDKRKAFLIEGEVEVMIEILALHPYHIDVREIEGDQEGVEYSIRYQEIIGE